jgi:malonate-semialdehyde dehydrogenase (acetylating) / methylmalonate-semialdehyde dehydrogenase
MFAFRDLVAAHRHDLAKQLTAEHGKTIDDALGEVQRGLEVIEFVCNIAHLLKGEYSEQVSTGVDTYTLRQPLGVVAGITPFNFPVMVPMWMYPVAIACGNTFVLKPSEKDPSVSMLAAELLAEAGLPDGRVQRGPRRQGGRRPILEHPDIAAVSFVGSTPIARYIYETGTAHGKRVQALGGAKNHMIVLPDADMDLAADAAVSPGTARPGSGAWRSRWWSRWATPPIACCPRSPSGSRSSRSAPAMEGSEMGPLVTPSTATRWGYIDAGERGGRRPWWPTAAACGRGPRGRVLPRPHPVRPRVTPDMSIYRDEIFGPVLSVVRVDPTRRPSS